MHVLCANTTDLCGFFLRHQSSHACTAKTMAKDNQRKQGSSDTSVFPVPYWPFLLCMYSACSVPDTALISPSIIDSVKSMD